MTRAREAARLGLLLAFILIALTLAQPAAAEAGAGSGSQFDVILDVGGYVYDVLSPGAPVSEGSDVDAVATTAPATYSRCEYDGAWSNASPMHLTEHRLASPERRTEARSSSTGRARRPLMATGVATEAAGVGEVNAVGGTHNRASCAIADDSTLAGSPASAVNLHPGVPIPGGNAAIEAYAGASWRSVAGRGAIESELLGAGNGARGVVYGTNGKTAHVWNAIVQDGKVNFVDFQGIGPSGPAAFDGWTKFAFVRTG